jgi:hypothetical protein
MQVKPLDGEYSRQTANTRTILMPIDGVWIGNRVYTVLKPFFITPHETLQGTLGLLSLLRVLSSCCLVAAFNGGSSPSSGFLNCPRASATSSSQQQLTTTEPQQLSNSQSSLCATADWPCVFHLSMDRLENTASIIDVLSCCGKDMLFSELLFGNGCSIFPSFAVVA